MSERLTCPACGDTFDTAAFDEDYCPRDGTRLVPAAAAETPAGPAAAPATEGPGPWDTSTPADAPEAPVAPDVMGSTAESAPADRRLADLMNRLGLRRATGRASADAGAERPRAGAAPAEPPSSPLPEAVQAEGWRVSGPVQTLPGPVDRWPVERTGDGGEPLTGHYHRFRTGAITEDTLYRRLEGGTTAHLARVWAHGTVDLGGARADYELVSLPFAGRPLDRWLADSTPSEQRAWHLFPPLVELLRRLADAGLQPLALEPVQLVLTDDGALWLGTAAALVETGAVNVYRPTLERSPLLPQGSTAPELTQQNLVSTNAAVFALGQVLALALWGQPCSPADLQSGAVTFGAIADGRLARVLMGCLWPRPAERWTLAQVIQAADAPHPAAMPDTPPWDSLAPGAASSAFAFAGAAYWRLETLLAAAVAPAHWAEATARLPAILDWAQRTAWVGQAQTLRAALAQGRSADWVLVALTRAVRPDAPLIWRGLDLADAQAANSLAGLAQRALRHGGADAATLHALFEADLRGAWSPLTPASETQR